MLDGEAADLRIDSHRLKCGKSNEISLLRKNIRVNLGLRNAMKVEVPGGCSSAQASTTLFGVS